MMSSDREAAVKEWFSVCEKAKRNSHYFFFFYLEMCIEIALKEIKNYPNTTEDDIRNLAISVFYGEE
jgi:hypothetical protein